MGTYPAPPPEALAVTVRMAPRVPVLCHYAEN